MEISAKTTVIVTKHRQHFYWEGYGLILHIPDDSLPPDMDQCSIDIMVSIRGHYKFPENYYPVSAVYWLRCNPYFKFIKSVSIEIQHCAPRTNSANLCFVRSSCTQQQLPYQFKLSAGGVFKENSAYGRKEVQGFSAYSVTQKGSSLKNYVGKVYYLKKGVSENIASLEIHFLVLWNTETHRNVCE